MAMNQPRYGIRSANGYPDFFTDWTVRMPGSELKRRTHGTTFDTITRQRFKLIRSALPHVTLAKAFENTADALMARALGTLDDNIEQMNGTLAALQDTLLPVLLSGKIRRATNHMVGKKPR